jgi:hypothetical protein
LRRTNLAPKKKAAGVSTGGPFIIRGANAYFRAV